MSEITKALISIQKELKAPKGQYNNFGKYHYRSCEDILEGVKPLLEKNGCILTLKDEVLQIGDRYYIKATATLSNGKEEIINTALAREEAEKKGMDGSQITGTASSYARKYCLNGLFLIDDTKDADTDEYKAQQNKYEEKKKEAQRSATPGQIEALRKIAEKQGAEFNEAEVKAWSMEYASKVISSYGGKPNG